MMDEHYTHIETKKKRKLRLNKMNGQDWLKTVKKIEWNGILS